MPGAWAGPPAVAAGSIAAGRGAASSAAIRARNAPVSGGTKEATAASAAAAVAAASSVRIRSRSEAPVAAATLGSVAPSPFQAANA